MVSAALSPSDYYGLFVNRRMKSVWLLQCNNIAYYTTRLLRLADNTYWIQKRLDVV